RLGSQAVRSRQARYAHCPGGRSDFRADGSLLRRRVRITSCARSAASLAGITSHGEIATEPRSMRRPMPPQWRTVAPAVLVFALSAALTYAGVRLLQLRPAGPVELASAAPAIPLEPLSPGVSLLPDTRPTSII